VQSADLRGWPRTELSPALQRGRSQDASSQPAFAMAVADDHAGEHMGPHISCRTFGSNLRHDFNATRGTVPAMNPESAAGRLAAILAADVAGYSRLIEADEEGTLARLKALRARAPRPHRQTTGDGLLVEFASVLDALRCAYVQICQYGNGAAVSIASRRRRFARGDLPCFDDRCLRRETSTGLAVTLSHLERM
jgi:hypothetical protein